LRLSVKEKIEGYSGAREKVRIDNRQSDEAEKRKGEMQKEDLRCEGDAKGYPVLESGRCVPGLNRTGLDSPRGIINQNIYA